MFGRGEAEVDAGAGANKQRAKQGKSGAKTGMAIFRLEVIGRGRDLCAWGPSNPSFCFTRFDFFYYVPVQSKIPVFQFQFQFQGPGLGLRALALALFPIAPWRTARNPVVAIALVKICAYIHTVCIRRRSDTENEYGYGCSVSLYAKVLTTRHGRIHALLPLGGCSGPVQRSAAVGTLPCCPLLLNRNGRGVTFFKFKYLFCVRRRGKVFFLRKSETRENLLSVSSFAVTEEEGREGRGVDDEEDDDAGISSWATGKFRLWLGPC